MTPQEPGFLALALSDGTPRAAFKVCLLVGTLLTLINQGDALLAGALPDPWKAGLTYLVPYCVATYGAVGAKRMARRLARRGERR